MEIAHTAEANLIQNGLRFCIDSIGTCHNKENARALDLHSCEPNDDMEARLTAQALTLDCHVH